MKSINKTEFIDRFLNAIRDFDKGQQMNEKDRLLKERKRNNDKVLHDYNLKKVKPVNKKVANNEIFIKIYYITFQGEGRGQYRTEKFSKLN